MAPEQTPDLIADVAHADIIGVSDHLNYLVDGAFDSYEQALRSRGLLVGTEVSGEEWVPQAVGLGVDYYVYHCKDTSADYRGAEILLSTGKPVIIAHPLILETDLDRVPEGCLIEINNRYIWRNDWRLLKPHAGRFRFVISSDAHQPNWLNQNVARHVARRLGVRETILFPLPRTTGA